MKLTNSLFLAMLFVAIGAITALPTQATRADDVTELATLVGHKLPVRALMFSQDGKTLISGGGDESDAKAGGELKLWNLATGKEKSDLQVDGYVHSLALSHNGQTLAAGLRSVRGSAVNTVPLWDLGTGKLTMTLRSKYSYGDTDPQGLIFSAFSVVFSPEGKSLIGGIEDDLMTWDLATRKERATFQTGTGGAGKIRSMTASRDGKTLAIANGKAEVLLLDPVSGKKRATLKGHESGTFLVAITTDGKTLASSGLDGVADAKIIVKLWALTTGKEQRTLPDFESPVAALAFSPDGKTLASAIMVSKLVGGKLVGKVQLWNTATGEEVTALNGAIPYSLAFSPDGKTLAVGYANRTIKLWNVETVTKPKK